MSSSSSSDQGRLFLDEEIPVLENKSVDEVASLIDQLASNVSDADVERQTAAHESEMASMKNFMQQAIDDGVIEDNVDENADDGTVLLKSKAGDYNPIMEAITKNNAQALSPEDDADALGLPGLPPVSSSESSDNARRVIISVPLRDGISGNEALRYATAAVHDALRKGEIPIAPLLTMGAAVGFGQLTQEAAVQTNATVTAWAPFADAVTVYTDLADASFSVDQCQFAETAKQVETRCIVAPEDAAASQTDTAQASSAIQTQLAASRGTVDRTSTSTTTVTTTPSTDQMQVKSGNDVSNVPDVPDDPMPDKNRTNRFTRDANNKPVQQFEPGVAGVTANGRKIPINNDGKDFDPKLPNVLGDMQYRNRLLTTEYRGELDTYKRFDKLRYLVVSCMGPKNCNLKTKQYMMRVWGAAKSKTQCAKIAEHVRKAAFYGRVFNIGVVPIGEWFETAPFKFSKEATATYSNPLHREYMEAYINEQKRATVELEQRVLDDEVNARQKTNTLIEQLKEKNMNPGLAPNATQAQAEIAAQRKFNQQQAKQRQLEAAKQQAEMAEANVVNGRSANMKKRAIRAAVPESTPRPQGLPRSVQSAARVAGGRRRAAPARRAAPKAAANGVKIDV